MWTRVHAHSSRTTRWSNGRAQRRLRARSGGPKRQPAAHDFAGGTLPHLPLARLHGVTLAEVAAAIGNNSIRGRLPRSQVAQIAVRLAAGASAGGRLRNGHLDNALDLIESLAQK